MARLPFCRGGLFPLHISSLLLLRGITPSLSCSLLSRDYYCDHFWSGSKTTSR